MKQQRAICLKDNLEELMKRHNMSLHQISKKTNINKSTLHNYLNGVLPQGLVTLSKLAQLFGISMEELLYGHSSPTLDLTTLEERYEIIIKKIKK